MNINNGLKEQFETMQDCQKQKLINKKQLKLQKQQEEKYCSCPDDNQFDTFDEFEDNLGLKIPSNTKLIETTDEYKEMQETVRELIDENGRLNKLLGEKEVEMKIIKRRWKEEKSELAGGGYRSENAATKIIEFSRKIRELTAELEKEKTKNEHLLSRYHELENKRKKPFKSSSQSFPDESENPVKELAVTKEKLSSALLKSAEERNEIETLKKELKIANKVLTREVGEGTFQSLLNSSSGWRGRQQQILSLQTKVSDLQQQVGSYEKKKNPSRNAFLNEGLSNANQLSHHDEKNRLYMRKLELEKKEQKEKLQKELDETVLERNSLKEKSHATKARIQILTKDVKTLKEQVSTYSEKGKHDDELISALLREQEFLKKENQKLKEETKSVKISNVGERVMKPSGEVHTIDQEKENLIKNLQTNIKIQEDKVDQLELEISSLRKNKSHIPKPPSSASGSAKSTRRPYSSSNSFGGDSLEMQLHESKSISEAAYIEKEKLSELVHILEERNENLIKSLLDRDYIISELKNTNVKLEKKIDKSVTNNLAKKGLVKKDKRKSMETIQDELEELDTKLSIQLDNNDALKEALDTTLKAKEDDLKIYNEMVSQTKKIFLQGMRQYKQTMIMQDR